MKVKVKMVKHEIKKHSVRYNGYSSSDREALVSVYVMKSAFPTDIPYPNFLTITIEDIDTEE